MARLSEILRSTADNGLAFKCPGCDQHHLIKHGEGGWKWSGDVNKPTFSPSVLVTGRNFTAKGEADYEAWYAAGCPKSEDGKPHEFESAATSCHSFVTDGKIQFLSDCTHALAGQTVDLPEFKED